MKNKAFINLNVHFNITNISKKYLFFYYYFTFNVCVLTLTMNSIFINNHKQRPVNTFTKQ